MKHVRDIDLIELSSGRAVEDGVREHLERCDDCRLRLEQFRRAHDGLGAWKIESEDLWPIVAQALDRRRPRGRRWFYFAGLAPMRAAAAVLLGLGMGHVAARVWRPAAPIASASEQDLDSILALYSVENPSPAGLASLFEETPGSDAAEESP
ncbi:MAG: hypothetical protein HZB38_14440 [Planctomycetes bacterium]|nr:hypothetical protein [Planctomycetota bacterium]